MAEKKKVAKKDEQVDFETNVMKYLDPRRDNDLIGFYTGRKTKTTPITLAMGNTDTYLSKDAIVGLYDNTDAYKAFLEDTVNSKDTSARVKKLATGEVGGIGDAYKADNIIAAAAKLTVAAYKQTMELNSEAKTAESNKAGVESNQFADNAKKAANELAALDKYLKDREAKETAAAATKKKA